jgi:hypothetical protein
LLIVGLVLVVILIEQVNHRTNFAEPQKLIADVDVMTEQAGRGVGLGEVSLASKVSKIVSQSIEVKFDRGRIRGIKVDVLAGISGRGTMVKNDGKWTAGQLAILKQYFPKAKHLTDSEGNSIMVRTEDPTTGRVPNPMFIISNMMVIQHIDFRVFILYNPKSQFLGNAQHLYELKRVWESWVRPGMISVYLAVPVGAAAAVRKHWGWNSSSVKLVVVNEPETYPPVKFELGLWKKVTQDMGASFMPHTMCVKLDMDTAFNPDQLLQVQHKIQPHHGYIGQPGLGRNKEYAARPYCMGYAYFIRGSKLKEFNKPGPSRSLPKRVVNSDIAVGHVLGEECQVS